MSFLTCKEAYWNWEQFLNLRLQVQATNTVQMWAVTCKHEKIIKLWYIET